MRLISCGALCVALFASSPAAAQSTGALEAEGYVALAADQDAQMSLGGFRRYLERTREADEALYGVLDARLRELEERELISDVLFWTTTILSVGALVSAIPVHEEVGVEPAIGLIISGSGLFLLGVIVQAFVRPSHDDLVGLIDLHDQRLGRR